MTLYNVHIYREMRVFFPGIEAASPAEAFEIVADKPTGDAEYVEDCDGRNLAALIDVVGDGEFERSVTMNFEAESPQSETEQRDAGTRPLRSAVEEALNAFWQVIVQRYPQAETGDLSPWATIKLEIAAENAIAEWIDNNVPATTTTTTGE